MKSDELYELLANFPNSLELPDSLKDYVYGLYYFHGLPRPDIKKKLSSASVQSGFLDAVALTGGVDSTAQVVRLLEDGKTVLPVYIDNVNSGCTKREKEACLKIVEKLKHTFTDLMDLEILKTNDFFRTSKFTKRYKQHGIARTPLGRKLMAHPIKNQYICLLIAEIFPCARVHIGGSEDALDDAAEYYTDLPESHKLFCDVYLNKEVKLNKSQRLDSLKLCKKYGLLMLVSCCLKGAGRSFVGSQRNSKRALLNDNDCGDCYKCDSVYKAY